MMSRGLSTIYEKELRPFGLRISQMAILGTLHHHGKLQPGELARLLLTEKSTVSRNVERMVENGWVRAELGEDERTHVLSLTTAGKSLLRRALPAWHKAQESVSALLGPRDVEAMHRIAKKLGGPV
jgi:DNA-binding MarR family transcriptional regulator